jgi:uncharacterized sulfatase
MTRRNFLRGAAIAGTAAVAGGLGYRLWYNHRGRDFQPERAERYLAALGPDAPALGDAPRPNIVLILVDDLGYGDLDTPAIDTPNLDRLTAEGVRLTSAYSSAALCTPSRSGLLTGRYPIRTHMTNPTYPRGHAMNLLMDVLGRYAYSVRAIPEDEILLPEALSRLGYHTGMVGKWHLGDHPGHRPHERGFDSHYGPYFSNDWSPYEVFRDGEVVMADPVDQDQLTQDMTREALAFIHANRDGPFFLYLAHPMPHRPLHASEAFRGESVAGLYGDVVHELDWSVGQVLDTLGELGLAEDTLVVFTSDNGPWRQGNPGELRGRKMSTFEGGHRVPFLARWPGVLPAGATSDAMTMNFDLFPTCLALAGGALPQDRIIDGRDILPLLADGASSPHEALYFYDTRKLLAVRRGSWKYRRRFTTDNSGYWPLRQGPFLYNLDTDPNESYSLLESHPDVGAELAATLDAWEEALDENLRGWK